MHRLSAKSTNALTPQTPQNRLRFDSLPEDLLLHTLSFFDVCALVACRQVCYVLRNLIATDTRLQYILEVSINGVIEGPAALALCIGDRLRKLQEIGGRMREYEFSRVLPLDPNEPADGLTLSVPPWAASSCSFSGPVVSYIRQIGENYSLITHTLPSDGSKLSSTWEIPLPTLPQTHLHVAAIDATQNLVVAHECHIHDWYTTVHLLSLESWDAHPKALYPAIVLEGRLGPVLGPLASGSLNITDVKIFGRYMAWAVVCYRDGHGDAFALEVRDWQENRVLWHGHFPLAVSYTFLDLEHLVMVDHEREDELLVYRFVDAEHQIVCDRPRMRRGDPVAILKLPSGVHWCTIRDSCAPTAPLPPPSAFFWPDPQYRVILLTFSVNTHASDDSDPASTRWDWNCGCVMAIPYETFRKHMTSAQALSVPIGRPSSSFDADDSKSTLPEPPVAIQWCDWGREGSLSIKHTRTKIPHSPHAFRYIDYYPFGSQFTVLMEEEDYQGGSQASTPTRSLRVLRFDLNPWAALRAPTASSSGYYSRAQRTELENFSDCEGRYKSDANSLETSFPRVVYRGPSFSDEVDRPYYVVASHQTGFTFVTKNKEQYIVGITTFYT